MTSKRKLRIAVLLGGVSSEREISLRSGKAVSQALSSLGHEVVEVDVKDYALPSLVSLKLDVAFIALHGKLGEDGKIQQLLEARRIPYTGSGPQTKSLDKIISKKLFQQSNLLTPPYFIIKRADSLDQIRRYANDLNYPVVLKPRAEGSSIGVSIHNSADTLAGGLRAVFQNAAEALIEKYISGREVTVGILEDKPLPLVELRPKRPFFDYIAKYEDKETEYIVNPNLPDAVKAKISEIALRAHKAAGCECFSRVDFILSDTQEPYVLEVNAIPGLTERSLLPKAAKAAGIDFPELCWRIVKAALSKQKHQPPSP